MLFNIFSVIVLYNPDLDQLNYLVDSVTEQVNSIVLIDNGSNNFSAVQSQFKNIKNLYLIGLSENYGIAKAQNMGIDFSRSRGASHILMFDQDSCPSPDMLKKLLQGQNRVNDLAALGPRYTDTRQENPPPFIRIKGLRLERCACVSENSVVPVDYLISSGCLIPMSVLEKVGGMREDFFIDYVDIEWGLRARRYGYQSYGVCAAKMQHSLGDNPIEFWGRKLPLHSPLRHYYHFRNAVLLYKEKWVPLNWKIVDGWRLCLKYGFYSLFAKPRLAHLRMMTLGVWDGLRGKSGKFRSE